ncbi:class I SAM-dependent methyltransferase [Geobacter sulfurreducens]|uniref:class I SAM-dependent methyltransferase n=1 Tax=Geobacter sulfurreducens TaxID=35554 RepID=UPI001BDCEC7B|nr:class I SAM-dependent methyltransferase [Geobacter sulfurreducens]QVW33808.1 class I SAM-dependent methyltransferase [Geobacter sulfurreducens]
MAKNLKNLVGVYIHDQALLRNVRKYFKHYFKVVDIGCGSKPYENLLKPYCREHIGIDHELSMHDINRVDRIGSAYSINAIDEEFDAAICTAVLEHLEEPGKAIHECSRVLKKGGIAIYTIPFIWHIHESPRDFYRYSEYGLRYLFEKNGFEIEEIKALSGFIFTFGQLSVYYLYRFHRGPLKLLPIIPAVGLVIQFVSLLLDRLDKAHDWTWMYILVARKK